MLKNHVVLLYGDFWVFPTWLKTKHDVHATTELIFMIVSALTWPELA